MFVNGILIINQFLVINIVVDTSLPKQSGVVLFVSCTCEIK